MARKLRHALVAVALIAAIAVAIEQRRHLFRHLNLAAIQSNQLDGRLIPHRINRVATLKKVLDYGLRSLEVDLLFRIEAGTGFFEVGHDDGDARGVRLDAFLARMERFDVKKLWLDVKNLREDNLDAALSELHRLDREYGLRHRAIIESYSDAPGLSALAAAGFHLSTYIRIPDFEQLLTADGRETLHAKADAIAARVRIQQAHAVSFRLTAYSFVKQFLEPLLPAHVCYHAWDSVELKQWNAVHSLRSKDYYRDQRLQTIIYSL